MRKDEMGRVCRTHGRQMHTKFVSKNQNRRDHSKDLGINGKITLECISGTKGVKMWSECIWISIGTNCRLL
jgi:hypothetical protein